MLFYYCFQLLTRFLSFTIQVLRVCDPFLRKQERLRFEITMQHPHGCHGAPINEEEFSLTEEARIPV